MEIKNDKKNRQIVFHVHGELPYWTHETMTYAKARKFAFELLAMVDKKK